MQDKLLIGFQRSSSMEGRSDAIGPIWYLFHHIILSFKINQGL